MKRKKALRIAAWIIAGILILHILAVPIVYFSVFGRASFPDFSVTPGIVNYEEYEEEYPRTEVTYSCKKHELQGYYYDVNDTDYLVVTVHGIKDYADWLLAEDIFFINNGYNVFSFDMSGCGASGGRVNGFSQPYTDMVSTMEFLNTDPEFKDYKKLLFGFSMGGYGVTSVLSETDEKILGVASVSGYDNAKTVIAKKGFDYAGPAVYLGAPLVNLVEDIVFGKSVGIKASEAIDSKDVPVLLAHGTSDSTIHYESMSIAAKYEEDDDHWIYLEDTTHAGILYSPEAREYQSEVSKEAKNYSGKEKEDYISSVDDQKYSELNAPLFNEVLEFFTYCKNLWS